MPRASLIFFFFIAAPALAAEPCQDRLLAFNTYERLNDEGKIEARVSKFPLPEDWSDASAFKGLITTLSAATLEVEVQGGKKSYPFTPWEKDENFLVAERFNPKKTFENIDSGETFILRLKAGEKILCEERREISGD